MGAADAELFGALGEENTPPADEVNTRQNFPFGGGFGSPSCVTPRGESGKYTHSLVASISITSPSVSPYSLSSDCLTSRVSSSTVYIVASA